MTSLTPVQSFLEGLADGWWLLVLFGIASIVAGVIVLVWPGISIVSLAWVSGIFLLVDGVFELLDALSPRSENRGMLAVVGALSLIAGLILVRHPVASVAAIALLLGIWFVAVGSVRLIEAFGPRQRGLWHVLTAVLEIIAGIVIVSDVGIGVTALAIIVGIGFIIRGLALAMAGWALRSLRAVHQRPDERPGRA